MQYNISCELDEVVMDVVTARHMVDELCDLDKVDLLHGGLQRALWLVLDSIKDKLEVISRDAFEEHRKAIDLNAPEGGNHNAE